MKTIVKTTKYRGWTIETESHEETEFCDGFTLHEIYDPNGNWCGDANYICDAKGFIDDSIDG